MTTGELIKKYRLERGWTQSELAKRMGYSSKAAISRIELNQCNILQGRVKQFADVLGVTPSQLFEEYVGESTSTTANNYGSGNAIATGDNCEVHISKDDLTPQESELIEMFRKLSLLDQAEIISLMATRIKR